MANMFQHMPIQTQGGLSYQINFQVPTDSSSAKMHISGEPLSLNAATKDMEMPKPPLALAPLQQDGIRPCNVSDILVDLVEAVRPLAHNQRRVVELSVLGKSLQIAVEEPALRHALSNLIESALLRTNVGGKVEIVSTGAPAGGAIVVIDDNGPEMHYMTQMPSLAPFGTDLLSENMVEDNIDMELCCWADCCTGDAEKLWLCCPRGLTQEC